MATSKKAASRLTEIPDFLLLEIFVRLHAPEDLARTSAACVSFRRLVTDRSFLRSFRRLHAPPLLGFHVHGEFNPALLPHPSAPAARALALAADFSFSFLPSRCRWAVQDIRDGRVLLGRQPEQGEQLPVSRELVVCDPVHRRYILLPLVPDDQVPLDWYECKPFLVPLDEEEAAAEETSFRVISMGHCKVNLSAFVFSSSTGQWTAATSKALSDLACANGRHFLFLRRHYAYGCFYWNCMFTGSKELLVLNTRRMEFSMADLPPGDWRTAKGLAIVEAGEGRLGVLGFHGRTASCLRYTIVRDKSESPSQWQMETTISLDSEYRYWIKDSTQRYLLLERMSISPLENPLTEYFSMDINTLKLLRVCVVQHSNLYWKHIYTNYPPSLLSSPTV